MACPTCSHTMQNVSSVHDQIFWCPRCGTLMYPHIHHGINGHVKPKLVTVCQDFCRMIAHGPDGRFLKSEIESCGILEATHTPEEREKV